MKRYMLDTDTCSYVIRERPIGVLERFRKLSMDQVCISAVTYAELIYGVERSSSKRINRPIVDEFVQHLDIIAWGKEAAERYGKVRAELKTGETPIGAMDMMIAAHAKSIKAALVTNNQKHFAKVRGLRIENWA